MLSLAYSMPVPLGAGHMPYISSFCVLHTFKVIKNIAWGVLTGGVLTGQPCKAASR